VFQPEPFSRAEAGCRLPGISKSLKMRGLRQLFFGTRPAFDKPGSRNKRGRIRQASTRGFDGRTRAPKLRPQLIEENSEFEEIPADGKQRREACTIRQTVPTKSSSAD
jgi:hypothetical protein